MSAPIARVTVQRTTLRIGLGSVPSVTGGGGAVSDGDKGDVTVSGSGTVWTVDAVGGASASSVASAVTTLASHVASTTAHGISSYGATLVDDANAAAARTTLGLGGSAVLEVGTSAGTVAAGDHLHAGVYQPLDGDLTAIAALTGTSSTAWLRRTAADTWSFSTPTASDVGAQALDAGLTSLLAVDTAGDLLPYTTAASTWAGAALTAAGRALLDDADASAQRTTLGLVIGTNVQAYDAGLASLAALPTAADRYAYSTAADTWAEGTITTAGRALLDDADASAQRTTLGLGGAAVLNVGTSAGTVAAGDHLHAGVYQPLDGDLTAIAALTATSSTAWLRRTAADTWSFSTPTAADVGAQALDAGLTSLLAVDTAADLLPYTTATDTWAASSLTAFARSLLDDADATTARTTLGAGDVVGPAGATANAVVRYDNTTGKLVRDSTWVLSDTGNVTMTGTSGASHSFIVSSTNSSIELRGNRSAGNTSAETVVRGQAARTLTSALFDVQNNTTLAFRIRGDGAMLPGQNAATSGTAQSIVTGGVNHTGQTASTEVPSWHAQTHTRTWAAGAITTQREIRIDAPTYAAASSSTITDAATLYVSAAPIAGTNVTITSGYALWVDAGTTRLDGDVWVPNTGLQVYDTDGSHRLSIVPGSNLTAARTLTITTGDVSRTVNLTGAHGSVYYTDSGGNLVALGPGTSGDVLTTNGAGANPSWTTVSGGSGLTNAQVLNRIAFGGF